jgi:hypothetical protein
LVEGAPPGGLLPGLQAQLAEQDFAQLLGRIQVEGLAGGLVGPGFQFQHLAGQEAGMPAQQVRVQLDAGAFHACQDGQQGHLHVPVHAFQPGRGHQGGMQVRGAGAG